MNLTPEQAAKVVMAGKILAAARAVDNRDWDDDTAVLWAAMLSPDVTLDIGTSAVRAHYASTRAFIMPSDINDYATVERARQVRLLQDAGPCDYPNGLSQREERDYRLVWQGYIKAGASRQQATELTDRELGYTRGPEIAAPPEVRKAIEAWTSSHTAR